MLAMATLALSVALPVRNDWTAARWTRAAAAALSAIRPPYLNQCLVSLVKRSLQYGVVLPYRRGLGYLSPTHQAAMGRRPVHAIRIHLEPTDLVANSKLARVYKSPFIAGSRRH